MNNLLTDQTESFCSEFSQTHQEHVPVRPVCCLGIGGGGERGADALHIPSNRRAKQHYEKVLTRRDFPCGQLGALFKSPAPVHTGMEWLGACGQSSQE